MTNQNYKQVSMNKDFQQSHLSISRTVSKQERDRLANFRETPVPIPTPKPPHIIEADLKAIGERQRESRIRYINQRLYVTGGKMQRDRLKAVHNGRAKASFNQKATSKDKCYER